MKSDISEFSYGFALTNELVGWVNLRAAPDFPSLIEEGKPGGGYRRNRELRLRPEIDQCCARIRASAESAKI